MTRSDYTTAVNTLHIYDHQYFTLNAPTVSDEDYDKLYFQVQQYEQEHPTDILPDSPTQYAHGEVKNGHRQVARRTPMLSTQKAQTVEAVEKWMKKTTASLSTLPRRESTANALFTVEWKYDGVSASLVYQDGKLIEASYGKGTEGNDCLRHCMAIPSIPNEIPATGRVEVRGEVLMSFASFESTGKALGYKNTRAAAAGILADTEADTYVIESLEFHPWYVEGAWEKAFPMQFLDMHLDAGFKDNVVGMLETEDELRQAIEQKTAERRSLSFPVDGLVIKVADRSVWERLGATAHHPKYSIAYKFAAATAETTITRIEITTGRTGKRTPVAYYEPVVINGATYQKASVGSEAKLQELGIEIGSRVIVSLRNDVIPHIDKSLTKPSQEGRMLNTSDNIKGKNEKGVNTENNLRNSRNSWAEEEPHVIEHPCNQGNLWAENDDPETARIIAEQQRIREELAQAGYGNTDDYQPRDNRHARPRRYAMRGESNSLPSPNNGKGQGAGSSKVITGMLTVAAICVIGVVAFAGLGAAVFFAPLVAGTLLKA